jgi:ABC-type branched-subunit amino acid transport system ATPase component
MAGVRLKRLKIDEYRNVAPGTELHFGDGFNVVLGENGAGKTTLLRLIAMIVRGKLAALEKEDFAIEYELLIESLSLRVVASNAPRGEEARPGSPWSYEITVCLAGATSAPPLCTVSANADGGRLRLAGERGRGREISVDSPFEGNFLHEVIDKVVEAIEDTARDMDDPLQMAGPLRSLEAHEALEAMEWNGGRFDEGLGAFGVLTGITIPEEPGDVDWAYLSVTLKARRPVVDYASFVPEHLREAVVRRGVYDFGGDHLQFSHDALGFLKKTVEVMGIRGATLVAPLKQKEEDEGDQNLVYNDFELRFTLANGTVISHHQLGYGEKRLVSFLYYAACNPDVVIVDELVNGLQPRWIEVCLEEVGGRQCFLSSQNAVLLDMLAIEAGEDAELGFVLCSREVREGSGRMVWKNMSDESAQAFFRAYEAHALRSSEILRGHDLW